MKILYIHGLDSQPHPDKLSILEEYGNTPFSLHMDYRKDKAAYWKLRDLAIEAKVEQLIGSSLGGYFAYWLGQELDIPQLLFNPAMPFRSVNVPGVDAIGEEATPSKVVLGAQDDIMPANLNQAFFSSRDHARVITCSWLGHQIDLETFEEMVRWAGLGTKNVVHNAKGEMG